MRTSFTLIAFMLLSINVVAQKAKEMTITKTDDSIIKTEGVIVFDNDLGIKIDSKNGVINSTLIDKVTISDKTYISKEINGNSYLIEVIITGNLNLFKGKKHYYLDNNQHGFRKLPEYENRNNRIFKTGTVSVYINNCKSAVELLSTSAESLTVSKLENIIKNYNACDIQDNIQLSEKVISRSLEEDEKIEFGLSIGFMHMNTDFNNIIDSETTSIGTPSFGAIVYFHSNTFNSNVDFTISADYFVSVDQVVSGSDYNIYSETKLANVLAGVNYVFNNTKSIFKPYIGISGGVLFNSGSSIILEPHDTNNSPTSFDGLNMLNYNFNLGTVINAFNQKFDFLIAYQPGLEMRFKSNTSEIQSFETYYESSSVNFKLTYVF